MSILQSVFNNLKRHGIEEESYTKGIMCLIFKKERQHENRKLQVDNPVRNGLQASHQMVANKLRRVCQKLIHKDQAGFVPNRSLFNHTRLAHLMVDYVEKKMVRMAA